MAEIDIGEHCHIATCHQLDFLPFPCMACGNVFCKAHKDRKDHACSEINLKTDHVVYDGTKSYTCNVRGCEERELTQILCDFCQIQICLRHRHQTEHNCTRIEVAKSTASEKTVQNVQTLLQSLPAPSGSTQSAGRGRKSKHTAAKVALMKLKQRARGAVNCSSVPDEEKIYLQVLLPKENAQASHPMYFNTNWSVGRVADGIAETLRMRNQNNVTGAKKLRLFEADSGMLLDCSLTLRDVTSGESPPLYSGSSVILEYVDDDVIAIDDYTDYIARK